MMMKILSKSKLVPAVKSLTRFRYVNYTLTRYFQSSCFNFITKHNHDQQQQDNRNLLLVRSADRSIPSNQNIVVPYYFSLLSTENLSVQNIYFPFPKHLDHPTKLHGYYNDPPIVYGPCNGLLCLEFRHLDVGFGDYDLALWNPSTKEIKYLPRKTIQRPPLPYPITHGQTKFFGSGFGFDSKSQDYKVIKFILQYFKGTDHQFQAHLYSLKSNYFKEMEPFPKEEDEYFTVVQNHSCYINGFHYWLTFVEYQRRIYYFILLFDFANGKFSTIPIPNFDGLIGGLIRREYGMELLDFNGSLGALVYPMEVNEKDPRERTEETIDLWVMNNGSWTREFSIKSVSGIEKPLGFWNGELFLLSSNQELLLFDPTTREIKNLYCPGTKQIIAYTESLVPINGKSELEEQIIRHWMRTSN